MRALLIGLVVWCSLYNVYAWWDEGHMIVASVAKIILDEESIQTNKFDCESHIPTYQGENIGNTEPATNNTSTTLISPIIRSLGDKVAKKFSSSSCSDNNGSKRNVSKQIETILRAWADSYPEFSTLISSAVWADHIKCTHAAPFCNSLTNNFEGVEIFNPFHYTSLPYHPADTSEDPPDCVLKYRAINSLGAGWLLRSVGDSLSILLKLRHLELEDYLTRSCYFYEEQLLDTPYKIRGNRHSTSVSSAPLLVLKFEDLEEFSVRHGSAASYNLLLRLFIHILGDIHQPLHSTTTYMPEHKYGDEGGNLIPVRMTADESLNASSIDFPPYVTNLHQLWDSAGGQFTASFPDVTERDTLNAARALMDMYPKSYFKEKNISTEASISDIVIESHNLVKEIVYSEFVFPQSESGDNILPAQFVYVPSQDYLRKVRHVSQERLVLAGMRLAAFLKLFVYEFPEKEMETLEERNERYCVSWQTLKGMTEGPNSVNIIVFSTLLVIIIGSTIYNITLHRRLKIVQRQLETSSAMLRDPNNIQSPLL